MCIGAILLVISVFTAWRVKALLVRRSADPEIQEAIDALERKLKERIPKLKFCFVEPDVAD